MKKTVLFSLLLLLTTVGIFSCQTGIEGETVEPDTSLDRKALLTQWADSLVKPGYQRFNDKLGVLKAKTTAFTAAPTTATLLDARQS